MGSAARTLAAPAFATGTPAKAPDLETVRRRTLALEARLRPPSNLSDKLHLQTEMGRMRAILSAGREKVRTTYPVNPPYAFVEIRFDEKDGEFNYAVKEPRLSPGEAEMLERIREKMESVADREEVPVVASGRLSDDPAMQAYLRRKFDFVVDLYDFPVPSDRVKALFYYIQRELIGLGRADAVLRDPFIEDVSCNGHGIPIYVFHRVFGSMRTTVTYPDELLLNKYIQKLAQVSGKHVSIYQPILDATLQDGSRINLTLGTEVTRKGSTFSIRKFSADPISPVDLLRLGSIGVEALAYLWHLIQHKRSILVSGGTASGKTTLLNAISMFMRPEDKVVSIEDTAEVHLAHSNWIQSVARAGFGTGGGQATAAGQRPGSITLFDLLVAALRQRPEYVLVGEVRGREASTLFQAIATGHAAMATIHAGSIEELLHRMESDPMNIPRALIQSLDVVIFPAQVVVGGSRARRLRHMTEILGVDPTTENLLTSDPYRWDPERDPFRFTGRSFILERIAQSTGRSLEDQMREVTEKGRYLQLLKDKGINHYLEFTRRINAYYVNPRAAFEEMQARPAGA
jgi:flagellar protein FlaI